MSIMGSRASALACAAALCLVSPATAFAAGPWQGFYVGAVGGYGDFDLDVANPTTPDQSLEGGLLGATAGFNFQSNNLVFGIEADWSAANIFTMVRDGNYLTEDSTINSLGTLRARLGLASGSWLPFVSGGFIWDEVEGGIICPAGAAFGVCAITGPFNVRSTETHTGWTVGGGVEYMMAASWSAKVEYLYADFDKASYTGTVPVLGTATSDETQTMNSLVRFGVNYRF
ncbi:MAG: outer membrane beta-barrel protein [Alphaproteobacteria bacterium]|nr:outer membrane beta-barrel protein [Alphaproteobacteria bacterium]